MSTASGRDEHGVGVVSWRQVSGGRSGGKADGEG